MAQKLNIERVVANFHKRLRSSVVATVHDFQQVTPKLARVVVCFNTDEADIGDLYSAVTSALGGKAVPVDSSFRSVHSHSLPAMSGFVRSNAEVLDFQESTARGMRAMAANVLMDPSDESIWEVRQAAGSKMLVRQGVEDLTAVLTTAKVSVQRVPVLSSIGIEVPEPRKFVAFVDPQRNITRYGYVLHADVNEVEILPFPSADETADDLALPRADNSSEDLRGDGNVISQRLFDRAAPISVGLDNLVETASMNGSDSFAQIAAPTEGSDKQKMIDYYRRVYSYAPEYFQRVVEIIQNHAGI